VSRGAFGTNSLQGGSALLPHLTPRDRNRSPVVDMSARFADQKGRRRLCSARRYWRKTHSRTPYPSANPTIRAIAVSSIKDR